MRRSRGQAHAIAQVAGLAAGIVILPIVTPQAAADDPPEPKSAAEMWSGAEATANSWFAYSGLVYAFGGDVLADGWRLKATTGGGSYSYEGRLPLQAPESPDIPFHGTVVTGDVSAGYQQRLGPMIARAFLGASYVDHQISPEDVFNEVSGTAIGVMAGVDLWVDIDARTWASAGGSYDTAFSTYAAYASIGYRVLPELSLGLEAGAFGNDSLTTGKLGGLLRWDTGYGEMTAAGGLSGDYADPSTPYGRIDWLVRF